MPAFSRFTQSTPWSHYLCAAVDIAFPTHSIRVTRSPVGVSGHPYPLNSAETIHIVTAFNPGGHNATARANLRAQHELLQSISLRGLQWWPAVGGDPDGSHAEISAAVVGMDDGQARALGRRFGQDAVFAWSSTTWRLLACADTAHDSVIAGWHAAILEPSSHQLSRSPVT
ncbi:DUF3293 domain-containing protein [Streptomyces sp. ME19-03-3]|nr:DUF3293 domain-containing protein [Streptomyces sp. ME19-03-3]